MLNKSTRRRALKSGFFGAASTTAWKKLMPPSAKIYGKGSTIMLNRRHLRTGISPTPSPIHATFTCHLHMFKFLLKTAVRSALTITDSPERKGARGERKVEKALTAGLDPKTSHVFTDIVLPLGTGTTQIDHVVVSQNGIFVI